MSITTRSELAHVLLAIADYQKLIVQKENIIDLLAMPEAADIEFDPPKLGDGIFRTEDFD